MNYIVCGSPGSGKSRFVSKRKRFGDLIVDLDELFVAMSGEPAYQKPASLLQIVLDTKEFLIDMVELGDNEFADAWVITGGATIEERYGLAKRLKGKVILIDTPFNQCLAHIMNDARRSDKWNLWQPIVEKWFADYEPADRDIVLRPRDLI